MRHPWLLSGFFGLASVAVFFWLLDELGLNGYSPAHAQEKEEVVTTAAREPSSASLTDREAVLKEQLTRYEKLVVELRGKLSAKEDELKMKLALKDDEVKRRTTDQEASSKKQLAEKDRQLQKLTQEIESIRDHRMMAYKAIYEKMDPKKAAKILNDLDINLAGQILGEIKESVAADIMSKMDTEKARMITEKNFGRQLAGQAVAKRDSQPVNEVKENSPLQAIQP